MKNLIIDLPQGAASPINYISVLASLENYAIPSSPYLSVEEFVSRKIYNWYRNLTPVNQREDIAWYANYE